MQVKTLTLFLVIFIFNPLSAQSPSFDLSAKVLYAPIQENTISSSANYSSTRSLNDSTAIRSFFTSTRNTTKEYKPELGYELMANINFHISDKLSIRTGLGVNLNRFDIGHVNTSSSAATLLSTDTISFTPDTAPFGISFCDSYVNSFSEFEVESDLQYTLINLRIPLVASLDLLDSRLRLNLGGYIQTPIDTKEYREYISLSRESIDGENRCEYAKHEETDTSGGNLSNLLFGYSVSAEYSICNNIALEVGALRDIGNTFNNPPNTFSSNLEDLTYTRYTIGLRYSLGNKVVAE